MTTCNMVVYCRSWRGTGQGRKCGAFWRSSSCGRMWSPIKEDNMETISGRHEVPPGVGWNCQQSLTWLLTEWSITGCQRQWRTTLSSTTGWDMRWVGYWGYSTRKIVSFGHGVQSGFRGASMSLLACSIILDSFTTSPSQK